MKKLKVFKQVVEHLLNQNEKAIIDNECVYLTEDCTLQCAVGCLISTENYSMDLEGCTIEVDTVQDAVSKSIGSPINKEDIRLLSKLQDIHDYKPTSEWYKSFDTLAEEWFDKPLEEIIDDKIK
jgi:hypothetical protein